MPFTMRQPNRLLVAGLLCAVYGMWCSQSHASIVLELDASTEHTDSGQPPSPRDTIAESQSPLESTSSSGGSGGSTSLGTSLGMLIQQVVVDASQLPGRYITDSAWIQIPDPPGTDLLRPPERQAAV